MMENLDVNFMMKKQKHDETSSTHSKGEVDNNKDIEGEGVKCQCNVHDQIEQAAEMSSTKSKTEAVNF